MELASNMSRKEFVVSTFKRIDRYDSKEMKQNLIVTLQTIATLSGIKSEISKADMADIVKMILKRFKQLSFEDIGIAFEMERYNEYDEKTQHFNLFNAEYVSAILKKYQKWKSKYRNDHNLSISVDIPKVEFDDSEYYELIYDEVKSGFTSKAGIYFDAMAKKNLFKPIPKSEYLNTIERVKAMEIQKLRQSNSRADRTRAKKLRDSGADKLVILKAKDIMITKVLSKLDKNEMINLLKECDRINQTLVQDSKLKMQETIERIGRNPNTGM